MPFSLAPRTAISIGQSNVLPTMPAFLDLIRPANAMQLFIYSLVNKWPMQWTVRHRKVLSPFKIVHDSCKMVRYICFIRWTRRNATYFRFDGTFGGPMTRQRLKCFFLISAIQFQLQQSASFDVRSTKIPIRKLKYSGRNENFSYWSYISLLFPHIIQWFEQLTRQ